VLRQGILSTKPFTIVQEIVLSPDEDQKRKKKHIWQIREGPSCIPGGASEINTVIRKSTVKIWTPKRVSIPDVCSFAHIICLVDDLL